MGTDIYNIFNDNYDQMTKKDHYKGWGRGVNPVSGPLYLTQTGKQHLPEAFQIGRTSPRKRLKLLFHPCPMVPICNGVLHTCYLKITLRSFIYGTPSILSDLAVSQHICQAHYISLIQENAHKSEMTVLQPKDNEWTFEDGQCRLAWFFHEVVPLVSEQLTELDNSLEKDDNDCDVERQAHETICLTCQMMAIMTEEPHKVTIYALCLCSRISMNL